MASGMLRGAMSIVNPPMLLNLYKYKRYDSTLKDSDALTAEEFKQSNLANYFVLDTSFTFQNGKANPNHLFVFFANLSQNIATDVQVALLQNVADGVDFYMARNTICLEQLSTSFETWVEKMGDERVFCDELGLMGLCSLYKKHCVVLTEDKLWSSIEADHPLKLMELFKACTIRLVYLGKLRFGSLKWRLKPPSVPIATPNVQFKIVEEFPLDDTSTSNLCASKNKQQEHVETMNPPEPRPAITEGTNKQDTSMPNEPAESDSLMVENTPPSNDQPNPSSRMETSTQPMPTAKVSPKRNLPALEYGGTSTTDDHFEHVETASAALQLSNYPWKKKLSIGVDCLPELDTDIWCNKISDYYRYRSVKHTSSGKVKHSKNKSDPTPDQLIARAKSLINQSKEWIDSAIVVKEEAVDKGVALVEATMVHVETDDKKKALSSLHVVTIAKLSPSSNVVVPVGTVVNKIIPPTSSSTNKKNRTVGCKLCEQSFPSVKDLNTHHRADCKMPPLQQRIWYQNCAGQAHLQSPGSRLLDRSTCYI